MFANQIGILPPHENTDTADDTDSLFKTPFAVVSHQKEIRFLVHRLKFNPCPKPQNPRLKFPASQKILKNQMPSSRAYRYTHTWKLLKHL